MALKVVIGTKEGKALQKEVEDAKPLYGMSIGQTLKGEVIDLPGYEFEITGGSDKIGFPMRKDVEGTTRRKILAVEGIGLKKQAKGKKVRKNVSGKTVSEDTSQLNLKVTKEGSKSLFEAPAEESDGAQEQEKPAEA